MGEREETVPRALLEPLPLYCIPFRFEDESTKSSKMLWTEPRTPLRSRRLSVSSRHQRADAPATPVVMRITGWNPLWYSAWHALRAQRKSASIITVVSVSGFVWFCLKQDTWGFFEPVSLSLRWAY